MQETMGQIIKRLRKERMLTQEALAERLGVTFQAVSKWETDAGMPDVSQIVPLANAFGVQTDVLFGMDGQDGAEAVQEMIGSAYARIAVPATTESLLECYQTLQAGLKRWPCHPALLMQCLEVGLTLAYPENEQFDRENGERIYRECVRLADLVIRYGKSATDILRAHMSMVRLHATYGNTEAARGHAAQFPVRADMTAYAMDAHIAHSQNELRAESAAWQHAFLLHLEALLDTAAALGGCYAGLGQYEDARYTLTTALALIETVFRDGDAASPLQVRERGDLYALAADVCLRAGETSEALRLLNEMADCGLSAGAGGGHLRTPLLRDIDDGFFGKPSVRTRLLNALNDPAFDDIRETAAFRELMQRVVRETADGVLEKTD